MATNWNAVLANTTNFADILAILRKVLGSLDGKVDITKIDEMILDITTLQSDVEQVIADGLMEGFATEAELLASRPTTLKKYAKAEDTKVIWFWNKPEGAPSGNYWVNTGLSELERAIAYADQKAIDVVQNFESVLVNEVLPYIDNADDIIKADAINAAATDATNKANTAKSEAIDAAATDATNKANTAKSEAIDAAATDATNKANT
ncbi:hypothetical protein OHV74_18950, partial [Acinetobacter baumannii]|nr:hypothetical protein [Acinetobacter baumannii]